MRKNGFQKALALVLSLGLMASMSVSAMAAGLSNFEKVNAYTPGQFEDGPADSWCADTVQAAYHYGLMNGKSETRFDPSGDLTVAQTIVMAARMHSIYNSGEADFETGTSPWYAPYLAYAMENGILEGDLPAYDVPVQRSQFAVILGAALPDRELKAVNSIEEDSIPDVPEGVA